MGKKITTIGNLTIDDVVLHNEEKMYLGLIGGDALYSAIGASIWGDEIVIQARIGNSFPKSSFEKFSHFGINTELVSVDKNDIRFWDLYEPNGSRQFVNHLSSGSHHDLSINGDELQNVHLQTDGIHVAPMPTEIQYTCLKKIDAEKGKDTIVSWDPQVSYLAQPKNNKFAFEMLKYVDIFLPSQEEVEKMYGSNNLEEAAIAFSDAGPSIVAIKKSTQGSLVYVRESAKFFEVPIFPSNAIDPTGAGDTYCGGFLSGYLKMRDPLLAAAHGTVSSSYVVEHIGALPVIKQDFADKEERLKYVIDNISEKR